MRTLWKSFGAAALALTCGVLSRLPADEPPDVPPLPRAVAESRPAPEQVRPGRAAPDKEACPAAPRRSRTFLRGVGNGTGNSIVIDNGDNPGTTVIENSRNGVGNRLVVVDGEVVTDRSDPVAPRPSREPFGSMQFYSPAHGCTLYWNPRTLSWYRYDVDAGDYVPAEWDF